jgi:hypothetical protein
METEETTTEMKDKIFWRNLVIRYWYLLVVIGIIIVGAAIGFILVLNWYMNTSALGGFGSWTFDQFSLGTAIFWCLYLVLWELLFAILPTIGVFALFTAIIWFAILAPEIKEELRIKFKTPKPSKRSSSSGGFGFLIFIGVCIFVFIDGNWLTPFGSLSIGYFIHASIIVFIWASLIFGIPLVIIVSIWFVKKYGKSE